jgi:hypothetical protein
MVAKNARKKKSINLLSTVGADSKLTPCNARTKRWTASAGEW